MENESWSSCAVFFSLISRCSVCDCSKRDPTRTACNCFFLLTAFLHNHHQHLYPECDAASWNFSFCGQLAWKFFLCMRRLLTFLFKCWWFNFAAGRSHSPRLPLLLHGLFFLHPRFHNHLGRIIKNKNNNHLVFVASFFPTCLSLHLFELEGARAFPCWRFFSTVCPLSSSSSSLVFLFLKKIFFERCFGRGAPTSSSARRLLASPSKKHDEDDHHLNSTLAGLESFFYSFILHTIKTLSSIRIFQTGEKTHKTNFRLLFFLHIFLVLKISHSTSSSWVWLKCLSNVHVDWLVISYYANI